MKITVYLILLILIISCKDESEHFSPTLQRPETTESKVDKYFKETEGTSTSKDEFSDLKKADESCSLDNTGKSKFGCSVK